MIKVFLILIGVYLYCVARNRTRFAPKLSAIEIRKRLVHNSQIPWIKIGDQLCAEIHEASTLTYAVLHVQSIISERKYLILVRMSSPLLAEDQNLRIEVSLCGHGIYLWRPGNRKDVFNIPENGVNRVIDCIWQVIREPLLVRYVA